MNLMKFIKLRENIIKQMEEKLNRKLSDEEWFMCSDSILITLKELA